MKNKKYTVIIAALSICFLFLISVIFFSLSIALKQKKQQPIINSTDPVYVYVEEDTEITESIKASWTVREYNNKIGVFNENGVLLEVIETYIKTLPKAEQELLREGFEVSTKEELYSIIEDYTD